MGLVLNEDQQMLREAAAGFLAEKAGVAQLRALRDAGDERGFDPAVWAEIVEMGWAGIAIPEEFGGLGYGVTGLGLVLEQAGRNLSPSPLQSTVLVGATLIDAMGSREQKQSLLPAIAGGERLVSLALQESAHHAPDRVACTARRDGDHYVLDGCKRLVLDARAADTFIVVARSAGEPGDTRGISAFLVDSAASGVAIERRSLVDSRGAGALSLQGVRVHKADMLGAEGEAWSALDRSLDVVAVGLAAELLGIASEAFERTVGYLQERRQFGRPIGAFQGLQHRAARLYAELELARSIVLQALQAVDAGDDGLPRLASAAKAKLCAVAELATNEAIQMHGGIGMTDEHDIGLFIKRARVVQHLFGDESFHLDRFARLSGF